MTARSTPDLSGGRLESAADASDRSVGNQFVLFLGLLAGFVSVFVVATTFAFVVTQRRRELGLLRIVGATPGQLRRTLLAEALVVGLPAALTGAVLGAVAAPVLGRWMVQAHMQAQGWEPRTVLLPVAASVLIGLIVALAGAWTAARRASRVRPLEALREAAAERRTMTIGRWICGGACAVAAVVLAALTPGQTSGAAGAMAAFASMSAIVALTLLAPVYLPTLVRVLCAPFRRSRSATAELVREGDSCRGSPGGLHDGSGPGHGRSGGLRHRHDRDHGPDHRGQHGRADPHRPGRRPGGRIAGI